MQLRDVLAVARHRRQGRQDLERRADPRRARRHRPGDLARDRRRGRPLPRQGQEGGGLGLELDQRQYYIAAHADEVYLHPLGAVDVTGFGGVRNYYKDALDKVGVSVKVLRAGTFKDFGEVMSPTRRRRGARGRQRAARLALEDLHRRDRDAAQAPAGSVTKSIDEAPERLAGGGRRPRQLALADKAVDGLKTRDELRALMVSRGVEDVEHKTFRQASFDEYLARLRPRPPATRSASSSPRARSSTAPRRSARSAACRPPT